MTKFGILKRKIIKAYNKKSNWDYSLIKGYPNGTYFGFESFDSYYTTMLKSFVSFYGDRLRKWRYH